ncbi:MAG TPA: hypothetical protein VH120_04635 [Gemmataceae bacterium]|nr:hypothetical protein [Gemmataceae bacterium]
MGVTNPPAASPRFSPGLVLLGAVLIPLVYLPTLHTRFDFIDDGNLTYPAPPTPVGERLHLVWNKIVANYEHLGPFRPVLWVHWELAAEVFHGDPAKWRLFRLAWCGVAVAVFLALLRELRMPALPALFVAALAFWNPYRNEIWTSLTLSEGVAMPYAVAALWCAGRANRSVRRWPWDLASAFGVFAALGCKNVFAAIVPAQLYLRMYADGAGWREGLRNHGKRAAVLGLTLLLPVAHYLYFRLNWHPGQYLPSGPTLAQFGRLLRALAGAESVEFLGPGLALVVVALWLARGAPAGSDGNLKVPAIAGALLLAAGLAVYLPIAAVSGRYTMPAVWGLDLLLGVLIAKLAGVPSVAARRAAWVGLCGGLAIVAGANTGRQEKFAARAAVLWDTLEYIEATGGRERVAWIDGPGLSNEEGIHFHWHLQARGREVPVDLYDEAGRPEQRCELPTPAGGAGLAVTGSTHPPPGGRWELRRTFRRPYWGGRREFDCYLWLAKG